LTPETRTVDLVGAAGVLTKPTFLKRKMEVRNGESQQATFYLKEEEEEEEPRFGERMDLGRCQHF